MNQSVTPGGRTRAAGTEFAERRVGPKILESASALSSPATRNQTDAALESAGSVIVSLGTFGGWPARGTATTVVRCTRSED